MHSLRKTSLLARLRPHLLRWLDTVAPRPLPRAIPVRVAAPPRRR